MTKERELENACGVCLQEIEDGDLYIVVHKQYSERPGVWAIPEEIKVHVNHFAWISKPQ